MSQIERPLSDFVYSPYGWSSGRISRRIASVADPVFDATLALSPRLRALRNLAKQVAPRKVLIVGVEVPGRRDDIHRVVERLARGSRHAVDVSLVEMGNRGKFENLNEAIARAQNPIEAYDWLVATDDDIAFGEGFLDLYLCLAEEAGLVLSQPAHAFDSYASYVLTLRRWNALVRRTRFVEIGPINFISAAGFSDLVPFPPERWGWGVNLIWTELAARNDWKIGIVDALPVKHLRPVARSYDSTAASDEASETIREEGITATRRELLQPSKTLLRAF